MAGFCDEHSQIVALEFFVHRLLMARCLESPAPLVAAQNVVSAATAEENLYVEAGLGPDAAPEAALTAISIGAAIKGMADRLLEDVRGSVSPQS